MGAFLDRLRGRPRVQPDRIRAVWNSLSISHKEYFFKVLRNIIRRSEGIREVFMANKQHAQNDAERDFVLSQLANRIADWFEGFLAGGALDNPSELKRICYLMGQQHAGFSKEAFKLAYWDEFTLAMIEELEEIGGVAKEDLKAWQCFLHVINEHMLNGYHDARANMK